MIPLVGEKFNSYSASVDSSSFSTGSYIIHIYQREINDDNRGSTERGLEEDCGCWITQHDPLGSPTIIRPVEKYGELDGVDSAEMCYALGGEWRCGNDTNHNYNLCLGTDAQRFDECMEAVPDSWWDKLTGRYEDAWRKCRCEQIMRKLNCELLNRHCDDACFCTVWQEAYEYINDPSNRCHPHGRSEPTLYQELLDLRPSGCAYPDEILDNDRNVVTRSVLSDIIVTTLLHVSEFNWDAQLQREVDSLDSIYYLPELLSYDVDQIFIVKVSDEVFQVNDKPQPVIKLKRGGVYRFDQSHSSNEGHLFRISTSADGSHNSGLEYSSGTVYSGDSGILRSYHIFEVPADAPSRLYYYCKNHPNIGGVIEISGGNINDFGNNTIEVVAERGSSSSSEVNIITR
tara:strand:- start:428 stop:1630 length:1203 start_codon:yes stop_codon:yes gene_type:complete